MSFVFSSEPTSRIAVPPSPLDTTRLSWGEEAGGASGEGGTKSNEWQDAASKLPQIVRTHTANAKHIRLMFVR